MKRLYTLVIVLFFTGSALQAQYLWDYGFAVGAANYLGDIGGKEQTRRDFVVDMKMAKTRWNLAGFVRYKVHPKFSAKLELNYLRIAGDDKLTTNLARNARNLNFRNDMFDLLLTGQFMFYENNDLGSSYRFKLGFRSYIFAGIGGFYSNPKANYNGTWVKLRPLQTEGVNYKAVGFCIPAGVGFNFTYRKKYRFGFELNWRTTFTDYLDDVSRGWGDPSQMDAMGAALSNRTDELNPNDYPDDYFLNYGYDPVNNPGNKRGDPTHKDSYLTMNVSYSYVLRGKSSFYRSRYGSFFQKKGRRKIRKIRAKF
jgi:hypothetical protein